MNRQEALDAYWMEYLQYVKQDSERRSKVRADRAQADSEAAKKGGPVLYVEDYPMPYERLGQLEESFWRWYMDNKM